MTAKPSAPPFIKTLPSLEDLQRERSSRSLGYFFQQAWPHYKPGRPYGHNWHIDAVCDHVQAVLEGQIRRLIINIPHRHTKSSVVAVAANAWEWGPRGRAWTQWIGASGTMRNATRDAKETRNLILSDWYQRNWGSAFKFRADQNEKVNFENTQGGSRLVLSPGGGIGANGDRIFCDDPNDPSKGVAEMSKVTEWWDDTMSSRLNDPDNGGMFVIQQRLDERDLTGHLLEQGGWEHLMLPAEFERERRCVISVTGFKDPRTVEGEPLDPVRHGRDWIDGEKDRLKSYRAAGMLQQRPAPKDGGLLKSSSIRRIKRADLPAFFHTMIFWDTASTDNEANDQSAYVVIGLSSEPGKKGAFILKRWADWLLIPDLMKKVDDVRRDERWTGAELGIEDANSGPAIIQHLQRKHIPVVACKPDGNKDDKAVAAIPIFESGLVWSVEEDEQENKPLFAQLDVFPRGRLRDEADALVSAVLRAFSLYTFEAGGFEYISPSCPDSSGSYEDPYDDDY